MDRARGKCALLTLGRLPVALEIARALHADGWRVVVAEPLAWHLCRASRAVARSIVVTSPTRDVARYTTDLLRAVEEEGVSLIVPVSEEILFVSALRERLPTGVTLACAPFERLMALHDKWRFAERARELGLAVPATALGSSEAGAAIALDGAHVVKRRLSCSGAGVVLHAAARPLDEAVRNERWIVQRRLCGASLCVSAFVVGSEARALVGYRGLIASGSVSVLFERVALPDEIVAFVEAFVRASGHVGLIAFDFVADAAGAWHAIECNPRATSALHLLEPATIADRLLGQVGQVASGIRPIGTRRQEAWSTLAVLQGRALRGRLSRVDWRRIATTPDVDWSLDDPLPFLGMVPLNLPLMWRALRARRPITEVTMADMGWYEPSTGGAGE